VPQGAVEIVATGDVNLGGRIGDVIASRGAAWPWTHVAPVLRDADLAIVNLECAVSDGGTPLDKEYVFRGAPSSLPAMAAAGVDVASLGNNHAADYGRDALVDTVRHVRAAGMTPVGAGSDRDEAYRPAVLRRGGLRIGVVGASRVLPHGFAATDALPGVASAYDERRLVAAVQQAGSAADLVVVVVHWGVELATQPNAAQRSLARALVEAGADLVVGHHPHVLQPVERIGDAVVAYSLGNFVFSSGSPAGTRSMILRVIASRGLPLRWEEVPVRIVGGRPEIVADGVRAGVE
jgi:poly-gamma-glutamate synthesis protein (capsule biosynthesis protein)